MIYEYECPRCNGVLEFRCKVAERNNPRVCLRCGIDMKLVVLKPPAVEFKGTGWTGKSTGG